MADGPSGMNVSAGQNALLESVVLTSLINHLSDVIFYKDDNCRYVLVNQAFADLVDRKTADIPGSDDFQMFPEDIARKFRDEDVEVLSTGNPMFIDSPVNIPGGRPRIFETIKLPFRDQDGRVCGVVGVARDITSRKAWESETLEHALEMRCLVALLQYAATFDIELEALTAKAVELIPTAWPEPSDIKVRIMLEGVVHESPGAVEQKQILRSDVMFDRHFYGYVSLGYYGKDKATLIEFRERKGQRILDVVANQFAQVAYRFNVHRALIESEYRHRILTEHSPVGLLRTDSQGQIIDCNQAAAAIFETTADRLRGLNCFDDVTESGLKQVIPIALDGKRAEFEGPFRSSYGSTRYLRIVSMPLKSPSGGFETISTLEDISDRRRNEAALAASELSLAEAQRIAHVGSWEYDFATRRLRASDECKRIFGVPEDTGELATDEFLKFFKGDFKDEIERRLKRAGSPETKTRLYSHVELALPDKTEKWVNIHSEVEKDSLGIPKRIVGIVHDVTEAHKTEAALREARDLAEAASRAKSAFMANVSHEIRTPMNAIIGMTNLVLDSRLSDRQRDYMNKINGASRALLGIIDDILDFSRIEADRMVLQNIDFSVEDVITEVIDINELRIEKKNIELHTDFDCDLPRIVRGDPIRLHQILNNLVGNAAKFTISGDIVIKVDIAAKPEAPADAPRMRFAISDTGIGMTQEQINDLFKPFSQLDTSTTREFGGAGLGLALCRKLVGMMNGEISVTSVPGQGSTFTVEIPFLAPEAPLPDAPRDHDMDGAKGKRVLVIDDSPVSRRIIASRLSACGVDVTTAISGKEGVATVMSAIGADKPFDAILIDLDMPTMDGLATAREIIIRSTARSPMVLMTTAYMFSDELQVQAARMFEGVVFKPILPTSLKNTLRRLLCGEEEAVQPSTRRTFHFEGSRILLVEDNRINQQVALELLRKTGARVSLAENGREAVSIVGREEFDVVLMDIQMPEMDGIEATRLIRKLDRPWAAKIPIIAMTAHGMVQHVENSLKSGMNGHLTKPVDPQVLYETLAKWIKGAHSEEIPTEPASTAPELGNPKFQHDIDVPGLNVGTGLSYVGGNIHLYKKLLKKFVEEYEGRDAMLEPASLVNNPQESFRFVHSIKSLAGTLGATALQEKAAALEQALLNKDYFQSSLIDAFRTQFGQMLSDIRTRTGLFDADAMPKVRVAPPLRRTNEDAAKVVASLSEALRLLQPRQSGLHIATLLSMNWPPETVATLNMIQDEIRNYRFNAALLILDKVRDYLSGAGEARRPDGGGRHD